MQRMGCADLGRRKTCLREQEKEKEKEKIHGFTAGMSVDGTINHPSITTQKAYTETD